MHERQGCGDGGAEVPPSSAGCRRWCGARHAQAQGAAQSNRLLSWRVSSASLRLLLDFLLFLLCGEGWGEGSMVGETAVGHAGWAVVLLASAVSCWYAHAPVCQPPMTGAAKR